MIIDYDMKNDIELGAILARKALIEKKVNLLVEKQNGVLIEFNFCLGDFDGFSVLLYCEYIDNDFDGMIFREFESKRDALPYLKNSIYKVIQAIRKDKKVRID